MNSDKTGESRLKPRSVELLREPVELYKVLKFEGLVASGGEAKAAIDAGLVFVNDKVERQKRKKLVNGDTVRMGEESLILKLAEDYDPASEPVKAKVNKIAPRTSRQEGLASKEDAGSDRCRRRRGVRPKASSRVEKRQSESGASNARRAE